MYVDALPLDDRVIFGMLAGLEGQPLIERKAMKDALGLAARETNIRVERALRRLRIAINLSAEIEDAEVIESLIIAETRRKAQAVLRPAAVNGEVKPDLSRLYENSTPNKVTREAIQDACEGRNITVCSDPEDMLRRLSTASSETNLSEAPFVSNDSPEDSKAIANAQPLTFNTLFKGDEPEANGTPVPAPKKPKAPGGKMPAPATEETF